MKVPRRIPIIMSALFIISIPYLGCNFAIASSSSKSDTITADDDAPADEDVPANTDDPTDTGDPYGIVGTNIKIDQFGYTPKSSKVAVLTQAVNGFFSPDSYVPGTRMDVIDAATNISVYSDAPYALFDGNVHEQSGDLIWHFDFSDLETPGEYYIYDSENNQRSGNFRIADDVYDAVMRQALRMFYIQRCGTPKVAGNYSDAVCHGQDEHATPISDKNNINLEKELCGGWHDVGDYNKYVSFTYPTLHNLLGAYEQHPEVFTDSNGIPESGNGIPDIIDEIKWELDWLQKMWQADGSVLSKVAVEDHETSSPASADSANRYYGPPSYASAITIASVFAHASIVFSGFPTFSAYAESLLQKAKTTWTYLENEGFPAFTESYKSAINAGFGNAATENNAGFYTFGYLSSAIYLFAATGETGYHQYFKDNYDEYETQFKWWWNQYDAVYEDAYLYYCMLASGDSTIQNEILQAYENQIRGSSRLLPAYTDTTDGYLAFVNDSDYVWSSNQQKSSLGVLLTHMIETGLAGTGDEAIFKNAAAGYLHYLHGVNPMGLVMLTNMYDYGGENCANEMYHMWFGDGTDWDNAIDSPYGPPPGFLTGGVNKSYSPSNGLENPLAGQPIQKWYKDWNTSYPEDSWEITEPAIYYQAAYVRLLSRLM